MLSNNNTLKHLVLSGYQLTDKDIKPLAKALLNNTSLKQLNLQGNKISNQGAGILANSLEVNTSLQHLILAFNQIGNVGAMALNALSQQREIYNIDVRFNQFSFNMSMGLILPESRIKRSDWGGIEERHHCLDISEKEYLNSREIDNIIILLTTNTLLQKLRISHPNWNDKGVTGVAKALQANSPLREICMRSNQISDEGVKAMAEALKVKTNLQYLDIRSSSITEAGLQAIAKGLNYNNTLLTLNGKFVCSKLIAKDSLVHSLASTILGPLVGYPGDVQFFTLKQVFQKVLGFLKGTPTGKLPSLYELDQVSSQIKLLLDTKAMSGTICYSEPDVEYREFNTVLIDDFQDFVFHFSSLPQGFFNWFITFDQQSLLCNLPRDIQKMILAYTLTPAPLATVSPTETAAAAAAVDTQAIELEVPSVDHNELEGSGE
jgi:hypothetical protein